MKSLPLNRRKWVTKHASENCGVGTTLVKWKMADVATCPRCLHPSETTAHIQRCNGHGALDLWNKSLEQLRKYLEKELTHPGIIKEAILYGLTRWRDNRKVDFLRFPNPVRRAVPDQTKIGWLVLMEGAAARSWQVIQLQCYKRRRIRKSGRKWIKGLLVKLHHMAWKQWNHRNKIKATITEPHEARADALLNQEITHILTTQMHEMSPADKHSLNRNLIELLNKSEESQRAWLLNASTARQQFLRTQQQNAELVAHSKETSRPIRHFKGKTMQRCHSTSVHIFHHVSLLH